VIPSPAHGLSQGEWQFPVDHLARRRRRGGGSCVPQHCSSSRPAAAEFFNCNRYLKRFKISYKDIYTKYLGQDI